MDMWGRCGVGDLDRGYAVAAAAATTTTVATAALGRLGPRVAGAADR